MPPQHVTPDECSEIRADCRRAMDAQLSSFLTRQAERDTAQGLAVENMTRTLHSIDCALRGTEDGQTMGLFDEVRRLKAIESNRRRSMATIIGVVTFISAGAITIIWNLVERGLGVLLTHFATRPPGP